MSKKKTEVRTLWCSLSEEEVANRADSMAMRVVEYDALEERKKELVKELSDELKAKRAEVSRLSKAVNTRKEEREVSCYWTEGGQLVRQDTGEVIEEDRLKQAELPLGEVN